MDLGIDAAPVSGNVNPKRRIAKPRLIGFDMVFDKVLIGFGSVLNMMLIGFNGVLIGF